MQINITKIHRKLLILSEGVKKKIDLNCKAQLKAMNRPFESINNTIS